jgi:hypothetical protein
MKTFREKAKSILRENVSVNKVADMLDISHGSAHHIIHEAL